MLKALFIGITILTSSCKQTDSEQIRKPNTSWQSTINPLCILDARAEKQRLNNGLFPSIDFSIDSMAFTENPLTLQANAPKSVTLYVEVDQSGK